MASFTDIVPQFNPFVEQLPIEAMVKVGTYKQQKYDEGIQKIQGYIDNIAGLDIYKDIHKEYLQSKLNELGNNLTKVAAGDFSNFQLVNSVSGMANQVIKDPIIQNAVSSTARIRKEQETIEADKKAGKLDPSNQLYWSKQLNSWLKDNDLKSSFTGSYIPNFDVFKFAKETFDAVKPDGMSWDEIYQMGSDGKPLKDKDGNLIYSPTMTRMKKEGRFPEKVKQTLEQIFSDPRVNQQLTITGEYDYRNYDSSALYKKVLDQKNEIFVGLNEKLAELQLKKNNGQDVQKEIDAIISKSKIIDENYNQYAQLVGTNPDAVRGQLYKDDVNNRYTTMFGEMKTEQQILENPAWRAEFDMQKEKNRIKEWQQEQEFNRYKFGEEQKWRQKEYDQKDRLALMALLGKGKKTGLGSGTGPGDNTPEQGDEPSDIDIEYAFDHDYTTTVDDFINQSDPFIWNNGGFASNPTNMKFVDEWMNKGLTQNQAIKKALDYLASKANMTPEEYRAKWGNAAITAYNNLSAEEKEKKPQLVNQYNSYKVARRNFDNMFSVKKEIERLTDNDQTKVAQQAEALSLVPKEQVITFDGKTIKLTKDDVYNISQFALGRGSAFGFLAPDKIRQNSNNAGKRLEAKGLLQLAQSVVDNMRLIPKNALRNPLSAIASTARATWRDPLGSDFRSTLDLTMQVHKLTNMMVDVDVESTSKKRAEIIKSTYGVKPNLKVGIMTGDNETDLNTLANIKRFAGAYTAGQRMNYSGDFDKFAASLDDDPKKNNLEAAITKDANNNPIIEIVSYGSDGERTGGMTIQPDEAEKLNLDINSLYEPKDIAILRNKIKFNKGKTSAGDPAEKSTYIQGDVYFEKNDFPALAKSKFDDVKGNIIFSDGLYYPYIYIKGKVKDESGKTITTSNVRMLPGDPSLQGAVYNMKDVDSTLANKILIEK